MATDANKRRYWEGQAASWQSSGLTLRAFCEREGIKSATFDYWRSRFKADVSLVKKQACGSVSPMTLVPVEVASKNDVASLVLDGANNWRLSIPASIDAAWLATLMKSLA